MKTDSQPADDLLNTDRKEAVTGQKDHLYFRHEKSQLQKIHEATFIPPTRQSHH